jgi:hypothetical protein
MNGTLSFAVRSNLWFKLHGYSNRAVPFHVGTSQRWYEITFIHDRRTDFVERIVHTCAVFKVSSIWNPWRKYVCFSRVALLIFSPYKRLPRNCWYNKLKFGWLSNQSVRLGLRVGKYRVVQKVQANMTKCRPQLSVDCHTSRKNVLPFARRELRENLIPVGSTPTMFKSMHRCNISVEY